MDVVHSGCTEGDQSEVHSHVLMHKVRFREPLSVPDAEFVGRFSEGEGYSHGG